MAPGTLAAMRVEASLHPDYLANTYLVTGEDGRGGFYVDAGGPVEPLIEQADGPTHVLLTHHHWDHVCELPKLVEAHPGIEVLIDAREREALKAAVPDLEALVTGEMAPGDTVRVGDLAVDVLHIPGHTA